jgi:2,5-diamino-6-(ribosylamino)-4(3H)-pyrimidinone 5'-phosphate reductase
MKPHVILHNSISVDGRINGFTPDIGLHYEIASKFGCQAHLAGNRTICDPDEPYPSETEDDMAAPPIDDPDDERSILFIPDSRGRVRNWHVLRQAPYWKKLVALCSESTSSEYIDYLQKRHVDVLIKGKDHVDMAQALEEMQNRYGITKVLLDSGGILNGILIRENLVDEVSLLIHPILVGGEEYRSFFKDPDGSSPGGDMTLKMASFKEERDGILWIQYHVTK